MLLKVMNHNWAGPAKRVCQRYPVGAKVLVYVDPTRLESAALEPRIDRGGIFVICAASMLGDVRMALLLAGD